METKTKSIVALNKQITAELADPKVGKALLATTFKGLSEESMRKAIFEGVVRGFTFKDFLEKNVYAIPYASNYSLVTSIDYSRKIGMKSGVVGKSAPIYTYTDDTKHSIESCSITIKRRVGEDIGEFTATVYFDEYDTGANQWLKKPRTMIAKVAEMHALRMACPEALSQAYIEDEFTKDKDDGYDHSEVTEELPIISTGDDDGQVVVPKTESAQKILIFKELQRLMPDIDLADAKEVSRVVADLTQMEMVPASYANIIHLLSRK